MKLHQLGSSYDVSDFILVFTRRLRPQSQGFGMLQTPKSQKVWLKDSHPIIFKGRESFVDLKEVLTREASDTGLFFSIMELGNPH